MYLRSIRHFATCCHHWDLSYHSQSDWDWSDWDWSDWDQPDWKWLVGLELVRLELAVKLELVIPGSVRLESVTLELLLQLTLKFSIEVCI